MGRRAAASRGFVSAVNRCPLHTSVRSLQEDLRRGEELRDTGQRLIDEDHYAVDCIRPKCIELQRMCEQYRELVRTRHELLAKSRDLHQRVEQVSARGSRSRGQGQSRLCAVKCGF